MRGMLVAAVLLAGCDGARVPAVESAVAADPDRVEAEKACAAITGYRPSGTYKLLFNEYMACVGALAEDEVPQLRGRSEDPV